MTIAPQRSWAEVVRLIMNPGALDEMLEADRARSYREWLADPYYPIRNIRAHGQEPSENALNALDGPAICDGCGATEWIDGGETIRLNEALCYGCGHIVCDRPSCSVPSWHTGPHDFAMHGARP